MRIHRLATVCLAVLATSFQLTACRTWRPQYQATATQMVEFEKPVRVTLQDGSRRLLLSARIRGDSVHGMEQSTGSKGAQPTFISMPMRDVSRVEVRQFSTGRTVGAVAATLFTVLAAAMIGLELTYGGHWTDN